MRVPDFVGVGFRRCASSWTHGYLYNHPQIGKNAGGLHYFSDHFQKGFDWYVDQLKPYVDYKVLLEYSVSYGYPEHYQLAAKRIFDHLPNAKIFMTVRNPIERAYSDYLRSIRRGEFSANLNFEQAIIMHPEIIDRGKYGEILKTFLKYYSTENIKVLFFDDLKQNKDIYINELCDFLGVFPHTEINESGAGINKGRNIKSKTFNNLVLGTKRKVDFIAKIFGLQKKWNSFKSRNQNVYQRALQLNATESEGMNNKTKIQLVEFYKEDVLLLQSLTNRNLKGWLK